MYIKSKLFLGFLLMISLTILLGITSFVNSSSVTNEFIFLVEHDLNVLQNAQKLQKLVIDAETGQRGFIIVGEESFLEPYYSGISEFNKLIVIEKEFVSDNPSQVKKLEKIESLFNDWQNDAAIPEIELANNIHKNDGDFKQIEDLLAAGVGKNILDTLRIEFIEFIEIENNLKNQRLERVLELEKNTKNSIIGFTIVSAISGILVSVLIFRNIASPISKLEFASSEIGKGNFDIEINKKGNDEISKLFNSFSNMKNSIQKNIELEKNLAVEKVKVKNERFMAIGELSARLAHDIRNPLSTIMVTVENIKMKYERDTEDIKEFERLERSISRIVHQIEGVLEFVKERPMEITKSKFSEVIKESLDSITIPENIKLILPKNEVSLLCDKNQFAIAVNNLILNSIQAIDETGTIEISIDENDDQIIIQIIDSGMGIPKEKIDKIFEPLYTTKQQGTGLGLTSVKTIIKSHGGIISVTSPPTIFTITLTKIKDM